MKRGEVVQFLQLINYEEILPLNNGTDQFKQTVEYCRKKGLITITPDNNCIISQKGLDLLTGNIQWEELLLPGKNIIHLDDRSAKIVYRLGGATVGALLIYELVIKGLLR
jgi:hypothetical protein